MAAEVRFAEVRRALERNGWTLDRIKKHFIFVKKGERRPIVIPARKGRVASVYVQWLQRQHGIEIE